MLKWPNYRSIMEMDNYVEHKQAVLVKLAIIYGMSETKVLNYQLNLFRSFRFRILAIVGLFNLKNLKFFYLNRSRQKQYIALEK